MARLLAALALVLTVLFARAAIAREATAAASLLFDARKIVDAKESAGWKIDRYAYEEMMPDVLMSVCRTTAGRRALALAEARREVERLRHDDEKDLLFAQRVAYLLAEALRRAPTDCSPWVEPQPDFKSLQAGANRFVLSIEAVAPGEHARRVLRAEERRLDGIESRPRVGRHRGGAASHGLAELRIRALVLGVHGGACPGTVAPAIRDHEQPDIDERRGLAQRSMPTNDSVGDLPSGTT